MKGEILKSMKGIVTWLIILFCFMASNEPLLVIFPSLQLKWNKTQEGAQRSTSRPVSWKVQGKIHTLDTFNIDFIFYKIVTS